MSSPEKRLDLAYALLGVVPRMQLLLRDFKADKPQNRDLIRMAPQQQTGAINRLIGLMNAANGDLAHLIVILHERTEKEELRFGWLEWARFCALEMWAVRAYFCTSASEPITESDYRAKEADARAEMLPVEDCANIIAEEHHAFDDADYETDEEGDRVVTDGAWYRVRDRKTAELRAHCAAGTLVSSGKGKRLKIESGSFYDWLGADVPVAPDFGIDFQVLPDHRKADVERKLKDHAFIRKLLDRGACNFDLPLDMDAPLPVEPPSNFNVEMAHILAHAIRTNVQENWRELRAIQERVERIIEDFDGEDVLHPRVRANLDKANATLVALHEKVQTYAGPFDLPEPDEELRATIEKIVEHEVRNVPMR